MIVWLNPLALWGLLAAAGAVAVHLLTRPRASRLPFPSVRFIRAASTAAMRIRRPSDNSLLLIRVSTITAAALALAQPLIVTAGRRDAWDAQVSRAIVVDTSRSITPFARVAHDAAAAEVHNAVYHARVDADHLRSGVASAVQVLLTFPPSRREIVVISDFQRGSLTSFDVANVPATIGLRFVQVGQPTAATSFAGDVAIGAPRVQARVQQITATRDSTTVRFTPSQRAAEGLRLWARGAEAEALLRAVARAGAPVPSREHPTSFVFADAAPAANRPSQVASSRQNDIPAWMLQTILRMRRDTALAAAARDHKPSTSAPHAGIVVARNGDGAAVVSANARDTELELLVGSAPLDFLAVATVRAALVARRGSPDWTEYDPAVLPSSQLSAWTRQAAPASVTDLRGLRGNTSGDARALWVIAVVLLALESVVRRRRVHGTEESHAEAA